MEVQIRPATLDDAPGITRVLNGIVAEGGLTALDQPVTLEGERAFLAALGPRAQVLVALAQGEIRAFQGIEPASPFVSMAHVAQLGTYVERAWRNRGLARRLWEQNRADARTLGFRKVSIQVRAGNIGALAFYRRLGFTDIGVARQHVLVQGRYEDEVLLERTL